MELLPLVLLLEVMVVMAVASYDSSQLKPPQIVRRLPKVHRLQFGPIHRFVLQCETQVIRNTAT